MLMITACHFNRMRWKGLKTTLGGMGGGIMDKCQDGRDADLIRFCFQGVCGTGTLQMLAALWEHTHMKHIKTLIMSGKGGVSEKGEGRVDKREGPGNCKL